MFVTLVDVDELVVDMTHQHEVAHFICKQRGAHVVPTWTIRIFGHDVGCEAEVLVVGSRYQVADE
jgi:hypothetical protein